MDHSIVEIIKSTHPYLVINSTRQILSANPPAEQLLGFSSADLQNLDFRSMVAPESMPHLLRFFAQLDQGGQAKMQGFLVGLDEKPFLVEINAQTNDAGTSFMEIKDLRGNNGVRESLNRRNAILHTVALTVEPLLKSLNWNQSVNDFLAVLGKAANVSRAYIFEIYPGEDDHLRTSLRFEWVQEGIEPQIHSPAFQDAALEQDGWRFLSKHILKCQMFVGNVRDFPELEREVLQSQDILTIAIFPILIDQNLWGFLGFDECRYERQWYPEELNALTVVANTFAAILQRQKHEAAVIASEERYRLIIENQGDGVAIVDGSEKVIFANLELDKIFGLEPGQIVGRNLLNFVAPEFVPVLKSQTDLRRSGIRSQYELDVLLENGQRRHLLITATPYFDELSHFVGTFGVLHDNTRQKQAQEQIANLLEAERVYRRQADTLREATASLATDLHLDQVMERILVGISQIVPYHSCTLFLFEEDKLRVAANRGFENPLPIGTEVPSEDKYFTGASKSFKAIVVEDAAQAPDFQWWGGNEPARGWICVPLHWHAVVIGYLTIDGALPGCYTSQDAALAEIFANQAAMAIRNSRLFAESQRLAITDPLTGLYNRRFLFELGSREFQRALRYEHPMSVLIIDLDLFKLVNDTYGHAIGDLVLRAATERIHLCLRNTDIFGRYGGDEFLALLVETDREEASEIAHRLSEGMREQPVQVGSVLVNLTVSIGIATIQADTASLNELVNQSDQAMYRAKRAGRNAVSL